MGEWQGPVVMWRHLEECSSHLIIRRALSLGKGDAQLKPSLRVTFKNMFLNHT